jgi:hypothetical protein
VLAVQIAEQGFGHLPELIRVMINAARRAERQKRLGDGAFSGCVWSD